MSRPRRLAPRYPARLRVALRVLGASELQEFVATDISVGGLFLATDDPPEIFTDVQVALPSPDGSSSWVYARVVHVMSVLRARECGVVAGVGLQFERIDSGARTAIEGLVDWAKQRDPRACIPCRRSGIETPDDLDSVYNYLLCAIDGRQRPDELAEALALELDVVEAMLAELQRRGLIERVAASLRPPSPLRSPEPATAAMPAREASQVRKRPASGTQVNRRLRAAIDARYAAMASADHYQVLEVSKSASAEAIRGSYMKLARSLHPDAYHDQPLGELRGKLERVFGRLNEAYGVLSRADLRAEYDAYLRRQARLAELPAVDAASTTARAAVPRAARTPRGRGSGIERRSQPGAASAATGSLPERCFEEAAHAHRQGDHLEAVRRLALLRAMDHGSEELERCAEELDRRLCAALSDYYEQQALYEERYQKWAKAAISWGRVCAGRPDDAESHRRAASALLEAGGDLRQAVDHGRRAVQLSPLSFEAHRTLGHVYMAAGMSTSARAELEKAAALARGEDPKPRPVERFGVIKRLFAKVG
ncbi:MAG: DnaJ domain-containing protein [Myxococcales bacterium]|nr:DnaJ domain-containing protein [Myxococcales bacterium]